MKKFYWLQTPIDPRFPDSITMFKASSWKTAKSYVTRHKTIGGNLLSDSIENVKSRYKCYHTSVKGHWSWIE